MGRHAIFGILRPSQSHFLYEEFFLDIGCHKSLTPVKAWRTIQTLFSNPFEI